MYVPTLVQAGCNVYYVRLPHSPHVAVRAEALALPAVGAPRELREEVVLLRALAPARQALGEVVVALRRRALRQRFAPSLSHVRLEKQRADGRDWEAVAEGGDRWGSLGAAGGTAVLRAFQRWVHSAMDITLKPNPSDGLISTGSPASTSFLRPRERRRRAHPSASAQGGAARRCFERHSPLGPCVYMVIKFGLSRAQLRTRRWGAARHSLAWTSAFGSAFTSV